MNNRFEFVTSLWRRSQSSYATTIPQQILAIKDAPVGEGAEVRWRINPESGVVEVRFVEGEGGDGDD